MTSTTQSLAAFLTACRGNWRNACFLSCGVCKRNFPCSGYLMSANRDARPVLISVADFERLTAQRIEPEECRAQLTRNAFEDIYRQYIDWCLSDSTACSLQMLCLLPSEC